MVDEDDDVDVWLWLSNLLSGWIEPNITWKPIIVGKGGYQKDLKGKDGAHWT